MPEGLLFRGKYVGKSRNLNVAKTVVSERSDVGNKSLAVASKMIGGDTKLVSMRTNTASTTESRK